MIRELAGALFLFALFSGNVASAHAQSQTPTQTATNISGSYSSAGFTIEFPSGWNGTLEKDGRYPVVSPPAQANTSMSVVAVNRLEVKNLIMSGISAVLPPQEPTNIAGDEKGEGAGEEGQCQRTLAELVPVNGINVFHTIVECPTTTTAGGSGGGITDSYIFFTLTKSVAVGYFAPSKDAYEKYLPNFTSSLHTVRVDEPANLRSGLEIVLGITKFYKESIDIQASASNNSSRVNMVIGASSNNINAAFDEAGKRFVIRVNNVQAAEQGGRLLVPVDKTLRGPYQVYVDGAPTPDPLVIEDAQTKEKLVLVEYGEEARQIVIAGTQVVPEFPLHAIGILAAALAALILYQRKKQQQRPEIQENIRVSARPDPSPG
nr:hypothetical protein [uncultured Nitrososphaera sp.]